MKLLTALTSLEGAKGRCWRCSYSGSRGEPHLKVSRVRSPSWNSRPE